VRESEFASLLPDISRRNRKIRGAARFRQEQTLWIAVAEDRHFDFARNHTFLDENFRGEFGGKIQGGRNSSRECALVIPTEEPSVAGFTKTG